MPISRDTPWREIGDVAYETWLAVCKQYGAPADVQSRSAWVAAMPHSGLALGQGIAESSLATNFAANPRSNKNLFNMKGSGPSGYVAFASWVEGIKAWRERITSPTYKNGIYAKTGSIKDLIYVFAPPFENDSDGYISTMLARLNKWLPNWGPNQGEPMPELVFGNVPHPVYQNRYISESRAWNDLGKRGAKCVVWHRMYGTLWGTDSYFRGEAAGRALTDYGVGVSATDGAGQAGVILQWNDPLGRRAPWASGPVSNPVGDGAKFVNLFGVNAVNRDGVSIEISGNGSTALDTKARRAVVELTAYWADQYGKVLAAKGKQFDYTTFPLIPSEDNRSFVCYHGEFYDGKRNTCPGPVVEAATDGMLAEVKALLALHQVPVETPSTPEEPVYATPKPPAAGDSIVNGRIFLAHTQEYTVKQNVTPRIYADPGSDPTGPDIKKGSTVKTSHVVSDVGEDADLTAVLEDGSRIPIKEVLV